MAANGKRPRYGARPGSPISDKQAEIVGFELEVMRESGVPVKPATLLERAAKRSNPLHALFDWNNESAAQKHRIEWARTLIGSVVIIEIKPKKSSKAFYSVEVSESGRSYIPRRQVLVEDESLEQVSQQLYARVRAAIEDAESLGLGVRDGWRRIIDAVRRNAPG